MGHLLLREEAWMDREKAHAIAAFVTLLVSQLQVQWKGPKVLPRVEGTSSEAESSQGAPQSIEQPVSPQRQVFMQRVALTSLGWRPSLQAWLTN